MSDANFLPADHTAEGPYAVPSDSRAPRPGTPASDRSAGGSGTHGTTATATPTGAPDAGARTDRNQAGPRYGDGSSDTGTGAPAKRRSRSLVFPEGPAVDPAGSHHERRIRSFRPRRGRVTAGQGDALRRLWSVWGLDIDGRSRLDLDALFGGLPVVLEIGFGMGDTTAQMAAEDPNTGILAADVHTPGQGNLLALAERMGLTNVRVANGDAIILLREMIEPEALAGLRVFFPDPWPKKRHQKRRLIQPEFVDLAVSRLRSGAVVHCATDWEPYAEQMLEVLSAHPELENTQPDGGFAPRPPESGPGGRPMTKFEAAGLAKGHTVHDLLFRRI